ncbi:MAG: hypothetical protein ABJC09_09210 [Terriglobia bacterium]
MTTFQITGTLHFTGSFHIGTGLSGRGVDRTIRRRSERIRKIGDSQSGDEFESDTDETDAAADYREVPEIAGDAIKGAIRGSAERIVRWLVPPGRAKEMQEETGDSRPKHPALRRIFAWQSLLGPGTPSVPSYRFGAPKYVAGGMISDIASTAVGPDGIAKARTLRVIELCSAGASFSFSIDGKAGEWDKPESRDSLDLILLAASIQATSHIGGKKGNGLGETHFYGLSISPGKEPLVTVESLERLRDGLVAELPNV